MPATEVTVVMMLCIFCHVECIGTGGGKCCGGKGCGANCWNKLTLCWKNMNKNKFELTHMKVQQGFAVCFPYDH